MEQENNFLELVELKKQYAALDDKLKNQYIINERMIMESVNGKISWTEKHIKYIMYQNIFALVVFPIIVLCIILICTSTTLGLWVKNKTLKNLDEVIKHLNDLKK